MEITEVVLFRGSLAYYRIEEATGKFKAHLLSFKGQGEKPPLQISFEKMGRPETFSPHAHKSYPRRAIRKTC